MEIVVKIKGVEYIIPEEVTALQWAEISLLPMDQWHTVQKVLGCSRLDLVALTETEVQSIYEYAVTALKGIRAEEATDLQPYLDGLTFGQWIDLDVWSHNDANVNIVKITSNLMGVDTSEWPLSKAVSVLKGYVTWRRKVYEAYENLFGLDEVEADGPSDAPTPIERVWYEAVMVLTGDNFTQIDTVTEKPVFQALNFLAYKKDKAEKEIKRIKETQRKL